MIVGQHTICVELQIHFITLFCIEFEATNAIFTMYCAMYFAVCKCVNWVLSGACACCWCVLRSSVLWVFFRLLMLSSDRTGCNQQICSFVKWWALQIGTNHHVARQSMVSNNQSALADNHSRHQNRITNTCMQSLQTSIVIVSSHWSHKTKNNVQIYNSIIVLDSPSLTRTIKA